MGTIEKRIEVFATKDFPPIFTKGDKLAIISHLYDEDTLIRNTIYGLFRIGSDDLIKIAEKSDFMRKFTDVEIREISPALYAPKWSYKDSSIELSDGTRYPSSLIRKYQDYFEKFQP